MLLQLYIYKCKYNYVSNYIYIHIYVYVHIRLDGCTRRAGVDAVRQPRFKRIYMYVI